MSNPKGNFGLPAAFPVIIFLAEHDGKKAEIFRWLIFYSINQNNVKMASNHIMLRTGKPHLRSILVVLSHLVGF
jgi:hypothetical protein